MKWLARLKKIEIAPESEPTETTKTVSVVFVGSILAPVQKTGGDSPAANDPAPTLKAAAVDVDLIPDVGEKVLTTAAIDPDRWPHSTAMNGRNADTFTARLARLTAKGVRHTDGEALADKLATRDRESDDRRLCLECTHLAGYAANAWQCRNWQRAGVAIKARDAGLPGDMVRLLQRCDGFTAAT